MLICNTLLCSSTVPTMQQIWCTTKSTSLDHLAKALGFVCFCAQTPWLCYQYQFPCPSWCWNKMTATPHFVNPAGGIPLVFVQYLRACIWLIGMSELSQGDANSLELVTWIWVEQTASADGTAGVHAMYWATIPNGSAESEEGCNENCPGETSETASPDGLNTAQQAKQLLRFIWVFTAYC